MEGIKEKIFEKGESLFSPIEQEIDKKCYELNNIENWAETFYTLKTGVILQRYKEIMSKSEYCKFFEALNYEYGINNCPLDTKKAFEIYKKAADTSPDTLSMYRLYRIYKKDYKKFNMEKRNFVLEKFYIMKCYSYLLPREKDNDTHLLVRIDVTNELYFQLVDEEENTVYDWVSEFFPFIYNNNEVYNLNKDDILLIEALIYYKLLKDPNNSKDYYFNHNLKILEEKGNPEGIYNLAVLSENKEKSFCLEKYEKLYKMNYYRSFNDYVKHLDYGKDALNIIKKSLLKGYYNHIRSYKDIFFMINKFEDIFKEPNLKSELMFIIGSLIDILITDDLEILNDYLYLRKITIKHFNFGEIYKTHFDIYTKEVLNYLMKFVKVGNEQNKQLMKIYFITDEFYKELYTRLGKLYYYGVIGIIERNFKKSLDLLDFLEKNDDIVYGEASHFYMIYKNKIKERKMKGITNKNDEDLIKLEKKVINLCFKNFNLESIKKIPPSLFYNLSKLFSSSSINSEDLILEYVLLNRAANAPLLRLKEIVYDYFEEQYLKYKAKKKIAEKNKEENFKKIKEAKGIINVGGYGEKGTLCPICFGNEKSIICLPCKHFFCGPCLDKVIEKALCPLCRAQIKITFDFILKKENLIKSILSKSYND